MSAQRITWGVVFGLIFALSLDYWAWGGAVRLGLFGLPLWVWYFFGLQLALAVALALYAKKRGGDEAGPEDPPA